VSFLAMGGGLDAQQNLQTYSLLEWPTRTYNTQIAPSVKM